MNPVSGDREHRLQQAKALQRACKWNEAADLFAQLLAEVPEDTDVLHAFGVLHAQRGDCETAVSLIAKAIALGPENAIAHYNYGKALRDVGRHEESLQSYDRALALSPQTVDAWSNRGTILLELGRPREAVESFDRVLAINPSHIPSLHNRANALNDLGFRQDAIAGYDAVLRLDLNNTFALNGRAGVLRDLNRFDEALRDYDRIFALDPDFPYIKGWRLHANMHLCNWTTLASDTAEIARDIEAGKIASSAYVLIAANVAETVQLNAARSFCRDRYPVTARPIWRGESYGHGKIRIGYMSAEFHEQATAHLTADLYECHDRGAFELHAFAIGKNDGSPMRKRLEAAFDEFSDVSQHSDRGIAEAIRRAEIDILVNLNGYFGGERTRVFALRPAPVQVNYLGYPATMGATYIDYIIADKIVIPEESRGNYAEKVVYLPGSYQPNDRKKKISERIPTRCECGLPETGVVFCCFNNNFKLTPEIFDIWMRLLQKVEGSVLWLYEGNAVVKHTLVREAEARGVAAGRLIFAPFVPHADHLARIRLGDLFLDTLPCNAHTTASDALWAGVPVLTCVGSTFAGRVAASLLNAAGLPELTVHSLTDYEALAEKLASDPAMLAALKRRLVTNRDTMALFDTPRYARGLEEAYGTMWHRTQRGEAPASFAVGEPP
jgi:predicted O-linked N-acetylglucosamine transferase (SPINDLY family)